MGHATASIKGPGPQGVTSPTALCAHQDELRETQSLAEFIGDGSSAPQGPQKGAFL